MTQPLPAPEFSYRGGALNAEAVPLARIAAAVGTPFYCYSEAALRRGYRDFASALTKLPATICFALKANSNLAVIRTFAQEGAGADVVSEGELRRALAAGVPRDRIVFSGVGKTAAELAFALDTGIAQINVESEPELRLLSEVAVARGRVARVAIRVNPDVDAATHHKIATGRKQDKFGIDIARLGAVFAQAAELPAIEPVGVAVHIGSQLLSLAPYRAAFERVAAAVRALRDAGFTVDSLDLGGGVGIVYRDEAPPRFAEYAAIVAETVGPLGCDLVFEPGRALVGNAGVLVSTVLYVKPGGDRPIVVVDAGMNDLKRPAMYGAYHAIVTVREPADGGTAEADVVGPICETGDTFATARPLPPVAAGDLVAFGSAGAYGAVMASYYNSRRLVPEVLVSGDRFAEVRTRPSFDDMIGMDTIPDWLDASPVRIAQGAA